MDPNGSQYNILVRVMAARARRELAMLKREMSAVNAQMARASKTNSGAGASMAGVASGASGMRATATATATATSATTAYANAMKAAGGATAATTAGQNRLINAVGRARVAESQLDALRAKGVKTSSMAVAADARLSAARNAALNATNRVAVAEARLAALKAKKGTSDAAMMAAEARVTAARNASVVAVQRVAVAEMALVETKRRAVATAPALIAAEERLALARRAVVGTTLEATAAQNTLTAAQTRGAVAESRLATQGTLNRMRTLGATTVWAGKQIGMFFTAPLLLAGAAAFKWQMDNEQAATRLAKVYDGAKSDLEVLGESGPTFNGSPLDKFFTALSEKMGQSKADIIAIGAEWAQVGVSGAQLAAATKLTTEAMVLGNMEAEEATRALVAIQAQYRIGFGDLNKEQKENTRGTQSLTAVLAQLNMIENQTGASMQDLVTAFAQSAAQARQAGVDAATLGAHIAALVPSMGSAARAGNALKTLYARILAPASADAAEALTQLAINAGLADDAFRSAEFHGRGMGVGFEQLADAYAKLSGAQKVKWAQEVFGIYQYGRGMQLLEDISLRAGNAMDAQSSGVNELAEAYKNAQTEAQKAQVIRDAFVDPETDPDAQAAAFAEGQKVIDQALKRSTDALSYYARALEGANDPARAYTQYTSELNRVLESNPQRFKQAGQILKNSLTDVIIPLIPHILWLVKGLATLAKAFSNLDPALQKFIVVALVVLALIGPITSLLGGFVLLASTVGKSFIGLGKVMSRLAFHFLGLRTGAYAAGGAMATTTPIIKKLGNALKWLLGMQVASDAGAVSSTAAAEAARTEAVVAGNAARTAAEQAGNTSRGSLAAAWAATANITEAERQAAASALVLHGNAARAAADQAGNTSRGSLAAAWAATANITEAERQAAASALVISGNTARTAADQAGNTARGSLAAAWAATANMTEAERQAAASALVIAGNTARTTADQTGQAARTSLAAAWAATANITEAERQAAANALVIAGNTARTTAERTGQGTRLMAIRLASPALVAAERANQTAQTAAVVQGNTARTAASAAGAGAAVGAAGTAANRTSNAQKAGVVAGILAMLNFIPGLGKLFAKAGPAIKQGFSKLFSAGGLKALLGGGRIAALFTGPIGIAIAAVLTLIAMFPKQIGNALKAAWAKIQQIAAPIMGDQSIPLLARPFVAGVEIAKKALMALPGIAAAVFRGTVKVIQSAAKAIYNAFSYINPFARHSPSLVENVQNGLGIVTNEFADADKSIQASMRNAYATINRFGNATAGLNLDVETRARNKRREEIAKVDPGSLGAYDAMLSTQDALQQEMSQLNQRIREQEAVVKRAQSAVDAYDKQLDAMNKHLDTYQDQLDAMNKQLEAYQKTIDMMSKSLDALQDAADFAAERLSEAKDKLDKYANAPIKGMRAMEDQIFANEMAQKKLQLALLDMGGEGIDEATDKLARLQGQIETLSGTRNELRLGGAGSDILSVYDQQLAALKAQQGAVNENLGPLQEMQKELERLRTEAERLDLEKSLKFDPLQRQISQLVDTTEELSFDQIVSGITSSQGQIATWTTVLDGANASIEAQQAAIDAVKSQMEAYQLTIDGVQSQMEAYQEQIDIVQNARDAANDTVDQEQEKLDLLNETYSQLEQTMSDLKASMDAYNESIDTTIQRLEDEAKAAEDLKQGKDILGDASDFEIPGGTFGIDEMLPSIEEQTDELARQVEDAFGKIDFLAPLKNMGTKIKDWFSRMWDDYIWPEIEKLPDRIKQAPEFLAEGLSYIAGYLFALFIKALGAVFIGLPMKMIDLWIAAIGAVVDWVSKAENWQMVGDAILSALDSLVTGSLIGKLLGIGGDIILGILDGIGNALLGIGTWLYDHVVQPFVQGFKDGFGIHSPSTVMFDMAGDIIQGLLNGLVEFAVGVWNWLKQVPGWFLENLGDLGATLVGWAKAAWDWLTNSMPELVSGFWDFIKGIPGEVLNKLGDSGSMLYDWGKNLIQGLLNGAGSLLTRIGEFFLDKVPDFIKEPFKKAMGIHSPSRVFAGYGVNLGEGLIKGMASTTSDVEKATSALTSAMTSTGAAELSLPQVQAQATPALEVASPTSQMPESMLMDTSKSQDIWNAFGAYMDVASQTLNTDVVAQVQALGYNTETQFATTSANSQFTMSLMETGVTASATLMRDNVVTKMTDLSTQVTSQFTQVKDAGITAMQGTKEGVTSEFQAMSDNLNSIFTDQIEPMFNEFQPLLGNVGTWFSDTVTNVGTQWAGIKEEVAEPSRFVINEVYNKGVKTAWNKVNTWLGLPPLEDFVAGFETGGLVDRSSLRNSNAPVNMIRGGKMRNYAGGDRTLYAGKGGEYVLPQKMAASIGYQNLDAARIATLSGRSLEGMNSILGFAEGGTVPGAVLDTETMLLKHARGQKYVYGGSGPDGFDCSGIASAVWNSLTGQPNLWRRAFDTEVNFSNFGFDRGLNGWATIGVMNGGGGPNSHMAGTLNGRNYESGGAHNSTAYGGPAAGSDHPQFQHQYTLKEVGGIFQSGGMGGAGVPSMAARVMQVWKEVMDPIGAMAGNGSPLVDWRKPGFDKYNTDVGNFLQNKGTEWDTANRGRSNGFGGIGSGVEVWRSAVQEVLTALNLPLSWDEITLAQMQTESGGNQYALNDWDSNWFAGTPSKGLMQVTDPTFQDFHWPGYPYDIWDPKANIAAGLRQVMSRHGGPQGTWGEGHGYDSGGILPPTPGGYGTYYNHTGEPEMVLTNDDWNAIYAAANNPLTTEDVAVGVEQGIERVFGFNALQNVAEEQAEKTAAAMNEANDGWQQAIYDSSATQAAAAKTTAASAKKTETGVDRFVKVGGDISKGVSKISEVMISLSAAMTSFANGQGVTFGMFAPLINASADLIEALPDASASYVPWAGFDVVMTEEMKQRKAQVDAANAAKGAYQFGKMVLPSILRSVASIGTAIEQMIIQDGAAWTMALGMLGTGNPMGAILIIALVIKEVFTILTLVLSAIMDIVPNLIKAIIRMMTEFGPDATYSYESLDAASQAVDKNAADIKSGVYQQQWQGSTIDAPVNQSTTMNFYGDIVMPNITSGDQAEEFVGNLHNLSEG